MSNDSSSTRARRVSRTSPVLRATIALLTAVAAGCSAPEHLAPVAARPAHSLLSPLLGITGAVGQVLSCTLVDLSATADTAVIGPSGGSLAVGRTRVDIPAGAVAQPETFVLKVPATSQVEVDVRAIGYAHYRFAAPVAVTVDYARCGDLSSDGSAPHAWYVDENTQQAIEDMGGVLDADARTLTFRTPHFSVYMLAE